MYLRIIYTSYNFLRVNKNNHALKATRHSEFYLKLLIFSKNITHQAPIFKLTLKIPISSGLLGNRARYLLPGFSKT